MIASGSKFLLGLINSQVADFFFRGIMNSVRGGYLRFFTQDLSQLPIPPATTEQQAPIVALVEQVLAAKALDPAADTRAAEQRLDALVAALYGLTEAETALLAS